MSQMAKENTLAPKSDTLYPEEGFFSICSFEQIHLMKSDKNKGRFQDKQNMFLSFSNLSTLIFVINSDKTSFRTDPFASLGLSMRKIRAFSIEGKKENIGSG